MKLNEKNINSLIQTGAVKNKMSFQPTPFDYHPSPINLVNEFLERELLSVMYNCINFLDIPDDIFGSKDTIKYKNNYVSFLLFLSKPTTENNKKDNIYKTVLSFKDYFYKRVVLSCITKMSSMLKTIFYRYYNGVSVPKLKIMKIKENKNFLKQLKFAIKKRNLSPKEIEDYFEKYIETVYIDADETLCDYIINWIKIKLDFFASDLVTWRMYKITNDRNYIGLADFNMNYWGNEDVLDLNQYNYNSDTIRLLSELAKEAEAELFISKLKLAFDSGNYTPQSNS